MIVCYSSDLQSARSFERVSNLRSLADALGENIVFFEAPKRWGVHNWTRDDIQDCVDEFDAMTFGREGELFTVIGLSDGGTMALEVAIRRSSQIDLCVVYDGRLWTDVFSTEYQFYVLWIGNGYSWRLRGGQATEARARMRNAGHFVELIQLRNRRTHFGNWDRSANEVIRKRIVGNLAPVTVLDEGVMH